MLRRQHWVMLAVALGLGLTGVLVGRFIDDTQGRSLYAVQPDRIWSAALPDLVGQTQALTQWRGRVVVLNFWAPWCPPCRHEIPGFIRLQERFGAQGLQFVGIAFARSEPVREYVEQAGINYPILLGGHEGALLGQAAGNPRGGLPYTLVLDRAGRPVASLLGAVSERRMEAIVRPLL